MKQTRVVLICILGSFLYACGGGTDTPDVGDLPGDLTPTVPPITSPTQPLTGNSGVLSRIQTETKSALKSAAVALANERYTETRDQTNLTIEDTQRLLDDLFVSQKYDAPQVIGPHLFRSLRFPNVYNTSFACSNEISNRGLLTYIGELDRNANGRMQINYDNCQSGSSTSFLDGTAYAIIEGKETFSLRGSARYIYYDNLKWTVNGEEIFITGYIEQKKLTPASSNSDPFEVTHFLNFKSDTRNVLIDTTIFVPGVIRSTFTRGIFTGDIEGSVYYEDIGKVSVKQVGMLYSGIFTFTSANQTQIDTKTNFLTKYLESDDLTNGFKRGAYFTDTDTFVETPSAQNLLLDINNLSIPPVVDAPSFVPANNRFQDNPIVVARGQITDVDTPLDSLVVSYNWFINGTLVDGVNSALFPPSSAKVGDVVSVTMVVDDFGKKVESQAIELVIEDRPLELFVPSIPQSALAGERITFTPTLFDPDGLDSNIPATSIVAGPNGASIDENGLVIWDIPESPMFGNQTYTFTFATSDLNESELTSAATFSASINITANHINSIISTAKNLPIVETNILVDDFNGDGNNQILTQQDDGLTLLSLQNNEFRIDWVYPFKLPFDDFAEKILSANVDDDPAMEIILAHDDGVGLLTHLNAEITVIKSFRTHGLIDIAVIDPLGNGENQLAMLYRDGPDILLEIIALNDTFDLIHSMEVGVFGSVEYIKRGEQNVYDLLLGENTIVSTQDWSISTLLEYSDHPKPNVVGDINGDGIDEVIVLDFDTKNIEVLSSTTRELMHQIAFDAIDDIDGFYSCKLALVNADDDQQKEIIVFQCADYSITQDYSITNYSKVIKLIDGTLQTYGNSNISLTSLSRIANGDINNDGQNEIMYFSRFNNSLDLYSILDGQFTNIINQTSQVITPSQVLGWLHTPSDERKVGLVAYNGNISVAQLHDNGVVSGNTQLNGFSNYPSLNNNTFSVLGDYNNDLITDVFSNVWGSHDSITASNVFSFDNSVEQWRFDFSENDIPAASGEYNSVIAFDINQDGYDDFVTLNADEVIVFDVQHNTILSRSEVLDSSINSNFRNQIILLENAQNVQLLAYNTQALVLMQLTNNGFVQLYSRKQQCSHVAKIKTDSIDNYSIACAHNVTVEDASEITIFGLGEDGSVEQSKASWAFKIAAINADVSKQSQQNLIVVSEYRQPSFEHRISKIDTMGNLIWQSPAVIGRLKSPRLLTDVYEDKLQILFLTGEHDNYIYWLK